MLHISTIYYTRITNITDTNKRLHMTENTNTNPEKHGSKVDLTAVLIVSAAFTLMSIVFMVPAPVPMLAGAAVGGMLFHFAFFYVVFWLGLKIKDVITNRS